MIGYENPLGSVEICQEYFASLIAKAASECFGVVGMINSPYQGIMSVITNQDMPDKGVQVRGGENGLEVDVHIAVSYGANISEVVRSMVHKVRYTVEQNTGFSVARVNVYVDAMKAQ